jgi:hypothetical protein
MKLVIHICLVPWLRMHGMHRDNFRFSYLVYLTLKFEVNFSLLFSMYYRPSLWG